MSYKNRIATVASCVTALTLFPGRSVELDDGPPRTLRVPIEYASAVTNVPLSQAGDCDLIANARDVAAGSALLASDSFPVRSDSGPLSFVESRSVRLRGEYVFHFDAYAGNVPIMGTGLVVTVPKHCAASTAFVEPERLIAALKFVETHPALLDSDSEVRQRVLRLAADVNTQSLESRGVVLDASGSQIQLNEQVVARTEPQLIAKWMGESDDDRGRNDVVAFEPSDRGIVIDVQRGLIVGINEDDGHGAFLPSDKAARPGLSPSTSLTSTVTVDRRGVADDFATGVGSAYESDPAGGAPQTVTLDRLLGDGSALDGKYLSVSSRAHDPDRTPTQSSDGGTGYLFEPNLTNDPPCYEEDESCSLFDNVNVYAHIDRFANEFWHERLGFEIDFKAEVYTHSHTPSSVAEGDKITLGYGGLFLLNNALEDDILYHEYVHVVLRHLGFDPDIFSTIEHRALGEGYSDYFALTYIGRPEFANWATTCPPRFECEGPEDDLEIRTLNTHPEVWNWNYSVPSTNLKYGVCTRKHLEDLKCKTTYATSDPKYVRAMIWGSTLWDIREALGPDAADPLIASSIVLSGGNAITFTSASGAILYADRVLNDGVNQAVLNDIFASRGIHPYFSAGVGLDDALPDRVRPEFDADVFPNPFEHTIRLQLDLATTDHVRAKLFDVNGRQVYAADLGVRVSGRTEAELTLPTIAGGFYILYLETTKQTWSQLMVRR